MIDISSRTLWIFLAIAVIFGAIWQLYPIPNASERMDKLPLQGPEFVGRDVPLTDFESSFFKDVGVVKRVYRIDGQNYFLTILDGTKNRHAVHDPYYCFRGGGWEIVKDTEFPLKNGEARLVEITQGPRKKTALYWFSDGKEHFTSTWKYWLETTLRRLTLGKSGPEPVLVVLQPLDQTTEVDWKKILESLNPVLKV